MTNRPKQIIHTLVLHPQISVDNAAPMSDHEHPVAAPTGYLSSVVRRVISLTHRLH